MRKKNILLFETVYGWTWRVIKLSKTYQTEKEKYGTISHGFLSMESHTVVFWGPVCCFQGYPQLVCICVSPLFTTRWHTPLHGPALTSLCTCPAVDVGLVPPLVVMPVPHGECHRVRKMKLKVQPQNLWPQGACEGEQGNLGSVLPSLGRSVFPSPFGTLGIRWHLN